MPSATALPLRHVEQCMGTVFSFDVRAPGVSRAALDDAVAFLHRVDAVYSTYRPDSVVSRLARGALRLRDVDDEVRAVLQRCDELATETDGYFSAAAAGALDPSGYVKGWAIDRASDLLEAAGSTNHCINGGGDVLCLGRPDPGQLWRVGVSDPHRPGHLLDRIQLAGSGRLAVATSGTAERGSHITDPHTFRAPTGVASVTVAGTCIADVDAYATAAFAMGTDAPDWLARRTGLSSVVVLADGRIVASDGGPRPVACRRDRMS